MGFSGPYILYIFHSAKTWQWGATRGHVVGALDQRLITCYFMSLQDLLLLNNNVTQANTRQICLVLYESMVWIVFIIHSFIRKCNIYIKYTNVLDKINSK